MALVLIPIGQPIGFLGKPLETILFHVGSQHQPQSESIRATWVQMGLVLIPIGQPIKKKFGPRANLVQNAAGMAGMSGSNLS